MSLLSPSTLTCRAVKMQKVIHAAIVNVGHERQLSCTSKLGKSSVYKAFPTLKSTLNADTEIFGNNLKRSSKIEAEYTKYMAIANGGGGEKALKNHIERHRKMLPQDRVMHLLDEDSDFLELSPLAGLNMEYGHIPKASSINVIGRIHGRYCLILASESTVKGGTFFPITLTKNLRAQEIALTNLLPVINLVDSGGAFLPLQAEIFNRGGRGFYHQAVCDNQIAIVAGSCTAGGAYVPTMSEETVMVDRIGTIFLGGPPLVQAALGEVVSAEELGGATLHCRVSGYADYFAETEERAYMMGRDIIASLNLPDQVLPDAEDIEEPLYSPTELPGLVSKTLADIDMYEVIARIVDGSRFQEFKKVFGTTLITGFARIEGYLVGILGNNGPMTEPAAQKGAHFVELCAERNIPLIFLQNICDSAEDLIGESCGYKLKAEAKMIGATSCAQVPKITVIIGNSIGFGNYVMCGSAMEPNLLFSWPQSVIAMYEPKSLIAGELSDLDLDKKSEEEKQKIIEKIKTKYMTECSAFHATTRLWNDGLILPQDTRKPMDLQIIPGAPMAETFREHGLRREIDSLTMGHNAKINRQRDVMFARNA